MSVFTRNTATKIYTFPKDADKSDMLKSVAEDLYKTGVIKLSTEYDPEKDEDVSRAYATIWWDDYGACSMKSETKTSEPEEKEKTAEANNSIWKRLFKNNG